MKSRTVELHLRSSYEIHLLPNLVYLRQIDINSSDFWLQVGPAQLGKNPTPRVDDHAMPVAFSFLIVLANLILNISLK